MDATDAKKVMSEYIIAGSELLLGSEVNTKHEKEFTIVLVLPADRDKPKEEVVVAAYDSHEFCKWNDALSSIVYPNRLSRRGPRRTTVHGEEVVEGRVRV